MLIVLLNIAIIIVVGAILFYAIDKYVRDNRLAGLLKILVGCRSQRRHQDHRPPLAGRECCASAAVPQPSPPLSSRRRHQRRRSRNWRKHCDCCSARWLCGV